MAKTGDCVVKHGANFTTGMAMVVSTFTLQQWNLAVVYLGKGPGESRPSPYFWPKLKPQGREKFWALAPPFFSVCLSGASTYLKVLLTSRSAPEE